MNFHPWHAKTWHNLQLLKTRLPHAILLHGPEGIGKSLLAESFAKSILCETPTESGVPCGNCLSCGWFDQYSHPDYRRIRPETLDELDSAGDEDVDNGDKSEKITKKSASKEIVIQQIRNLSDFFTLSTHRQGWRVVVLYPVETLNSPAANSLLKSLEEPQSKTLFVLVSNAIDRVLPTILSRCHKFPIPMPSADVSLSWLKEQNISNAENWLAQSGGAPLIAMERAQSENWEDMQEWIKALANPSIGLGLALADKLQKSSLPEIINMTLRWIYDLIVANQNSKVRYYPKYDKAIQNLAIRADANKLFTVLDACIQKKAIANHPLSPKLFLEELYLEYHKIFE